MSPPPDDKHPLARTAPRRGVHKHAYSLPKPYRKPVSSEGRARLSRLQVALLALAAMLVASLIATVALLAHENASARHPLPVVAAPDPARAFPAKVAAFPGQADIAAGGRGPARGPANATGKNRAPSVLPKLVVAVLDRDPKAARAEALPAPDPDVVLITAILLLTPPQPGGGWDGAPSCSVVPIQTQECEHLHGMQP